MRSDRQSDRSNAWWLDVPLGMVLRRALRFLAVLARYSSLWKERARVDARWNGM